MIAREGAGVETGRPQLLGGCTVIRPILVGLNKPVQIVGLSAKDSDKANMAAIAAYDGAEVTNPAAWGLKANDVASGTTSA